MKLSNEHLATLLDNISEAIVVADRTYQIVYFNRAAVQVFGYSAEEILGRPLDLLLPERFGEIHRQHVREFSAASQTIGMIENRPGLVARRKDGTEFPARIGISKIAQGGEEFYTAIVVDITERQRAETQLVYQAQLLESINDAIVASDANYKLTAWNAAAEKMYGWTANEVLGRPGLQITRTEWQAVDADDMRRTIAETCKWRGEATQERKDGTRFPVEVSSIVLHDQTGKVTGYVSVNRDITERKRLEEQLRASEEKFRALIEHGSEAIATVDAQGKVLYGSSAARRMLGFRQHERLGQSVFDWVHPDDLEHTRGIFVQLVSEPGSTQTGEFRLQHEDRRWRWIEAVGTNLLNLPAVHAIVINYRDITERKQAEEALQESEEKFRLIAERITEVFYLVDIRNNQTLYVSPGFEQVWGMSRSEAEQSPQNFMKAIHPDDLDRVKEGLEVMQNGLPFDLEYRIIRPDGVMRWIWDRGYPLRSANGTINRYVGVAQDITERKRADEALRKSEEQYRTLVTQSPDGIFILDLQGRFKSVNKAICDGLKYTEDELLSMKIWDIVPQKYLDQHKSRIAEILRGNAPSEAVEYEVRAKDGTTRFIEVLSAPQLDGTQVIGLQAIARDITERKRAEDQIRFQASLLDQVTNGVAASDLDGTIIYWNHYAEVLHGWKAEEVLGKHPQEFLIPPSEIQWATEAMQSVNSLNKSEIDLLLLKKDASSFPAHVNYAVMKNNQGQPIGFLGVSTDITERKKADAKLQEQLERLAALREVDQVIASTFDLGMGLNLLLSHTQRLLGVDAAAVLLFDPAQNVLEYSVGIGFRTDIIQHASVKLGTGVAGKVALERRIIEIRSRSNELDTQLLTDLLHEENFVSYHGAPLIMKGQVIGVLEVFNRSFIERDHDWLDFFSILAGQAAIMVDATQLFNDLQATNMDLSLAYDATIEGWSRALDLRDKETEGHTQRVTELTMQLARQFGFPDDELVHIRRGALLHDIGKLGVPDHILLKSEALTKPEWEIMKKHPRLAYELLSPIHYLKSAAIDIPYCHHEKWDGTGYPRGLKGKQIPLAARIFTIVDVWDALRSDRPYRSAWSIEKVREHLQSLAGSHFDPQVVQVFLNLFQDAQSISQP